MSEYRTPNFDGYDERIAAGMMRVNNESKAGLPAYLGARFVEFAPGRLHAAMEVRADLMTPLGTLHGGVMAGFVDHVMGCVLYPLMKPGQWAATTEFKLNYLAAVKSGTLIAESTVLALGSRSAVIRVEVVNGDRLVCTAQGTLLVSDPPKGK